MIDKHIKGLSNNRISKQNNRSLSRMKQEGSDAKGASKRLRLYALWLKPKAPLQHTLQDGDR